MLKSTTDEEDSTGMADMEPSYTLTPNLCFFYHIKTNYILDSFCKRIVMNYLVINNISDQIVKLTVLVHLLILEIFQHIICNSITINQLTYGIPEALFINTARDNFI